MFAYKTSLLAVLFFSFALMCCKPLKAAEAQSVDYVGETRPITSTVRIPGDTSQGLYQSGRVGKDFHIVFMGLPATELVELELGFAELEGNKAGERTFDVFVNDKRAITALDIAAEAGGPLKPLIKKFTITPKRGFVDFHFVGLKGEATVNFLRVRTSKGEKLVTAPREITAALTSPEEEGPLPDMLANFKPETGQISLDASSGTWQGGMPLGGIGTGKFEILPNGQFANFTINNSWDLPVLRPKGTFLAVAMKATSRGGLSRVLQVNPESGNVTPFPKTDYIPSASHTGIYPFGEWRMTDEQIYVDVEVDAWSPIVPYNVDDSSLPASVISVTLHNTKNYPVSAAVALSWEDLNGRGGSAIGGDQFGHAGAAVHSDAATSSITGIHIKSGSPTTDRKGTFTGDYFVGTPIKGAAISRSLFWNPRGGTIPWWRQFSTKLRLDRTPVEPAIVNAPAGSGPGAAALCVSFNLAPKERRRVPFIVSWNMPRLSTVASPQSPSTTEDLDYAERFGSSIGVASYLATNRARLESETRAWHDLLLRSSLPMWLKTHTLNSLAPLTANSILLKNDRFALLEAPGDGKGMLGPVDLRLQSSEFMRTFYPSLDRTEIELFARGQNPDGSLPRYVGNIHGALAGFDTRMLGAGWLDPAAAWIIQAQANWRETGDESFRERIKPAVQKAANFLTTSLESATTHPTAMAVGGNFATANQMALGNVAAALSAAEAITGNLITQTGQATEMYQASIAHGQKSGVFSAALSGDWLARSTGLAPVVDDGQLSAALSIIGEGQINSYTPVAAMEASVDGAAIKEMSSPVLLQGLLGSAAVSAGYSRFGFDLWLRMFQVAYAAQKMPWRQALWYDVPVGAKPAMRGHLSSMGAWTAWRALSGAMVDVTAKRLYLNPQPLPDAETQDLAMPVFTPVFWGWLEFNASESTGTLSVTRVCPGYEDFMLVEVAQKLARDGSPVKLVKFPEPVVLKEGATFTLMNWPAEATGTVELMPELKVDDVRTSGGISMDDTGTTGSLDTDDAETSGVLTVTKEGDTTGTFGP